MRGKVVCVCCGAEVERVNSKQKYCPVCRIKVMREQQAESKRRNRAKKKYYAFSSIGDTEEMRNMCLNCKMVKCNGGCQALAMLSKKGKSDEQTEQKGG